MLVSCLGALSEFFRVAVSSSATGTFWLPLVEWKLKTRQLLKQDGILSGLCPRTLKNLGLISQNGYTWNKRSSACKVKFQESPLGSRTKAGYKTKTKVAWVREVIWFYSALKTGPLCPLKQVGFFPFFSHSDLDMIFLEKAQRLCVFTLEGVLMHKSLNVYTCKKRAIWKLLYTSTLKNVNITRRKSII